MSKILNDFIPKRYAIGTGVAYDSLGHNTPQLDLVIWDEQNYPRIEQFGHKLFFAESVKATIEIKTNYNTNNLKDIINKCSAVTKLHSMVKDLSIEETINSLEQKMYCLENGYEDNGALIVKPPIATGAIVLTGGANDINLEKIRGDFYDDLEDSWPEIMLFLEAGIVCVNDIYVGQLDIIYGEEDSLLIFMLNFLKILKTRTIDVNGDFYLDYYAMDLMNNKKIDSIKYEFTKFPPGRTPV